jgi:hypothetical protein
MNEDKKVFRIEAKDFLTCLKSLKHSERIFSDAIERSDFPMGANEDEFRGYLNEIRETREKIETILEQHRETVH